LHRFGRGRNRQTPIAKASNEHPNGFSQAEGEPRHWAEHYEKGEDSNYDRRQCAMTIKFCREPIEDWVERYSNDNAPDYDRQKRSDQDERPVPQKSKADHSDDENHEFFVQCTKP
jgi:hypothetical protein